MGKVHPFHLAILSAHYAQKDNNAAQPIVVLDPKEYERIFQEFAATKEGTQVTLLYKLSKGHTTAVKLEKTADGINLIHMDSVINPKYQEEVTKPILNLMAQPHNQDKSLKIYLMKPLDSRQKDDSSCTIYATKDARFLNRMSHFSQGIKVVKEVPSDNNRVKIFQGELPTVAYRSTQSTTLFRSIFKNLLNEAVNRAGLTPQNITDKYGKGGYIEHFGKKYSDIIENFEYVGDPSTLGPYTSRSVTTASLEAMEVIRTPLYSDHGKLGQIMPDDKHLRAQLHEAVEQNRVDVVRELIGRGVHPDSELNGVRPLFRAVQLGNQEMVTLLLGQPNVNPLHCELSSGKYITPFQMAYEQNDSEMIKLLLSSGVDEYTLFTWESFLNQALHKAVESNDLPRLKQLVAMGLDPHIRSDDTDCFPLQTAVEHGFVEIVAFLLQQPSVDANCLDVSNITPLLIAFYNNQFDVARVLLLNPQVTITPSIAEEVAQVPICQQHDILPPSPFSSDAMKQVLLAHLPALAKTALHSESPVRASSQTQSIEPGEQGPDSAVDPGMKMS